MVMENAVMKPEKKRLHFKSPASLLSMNKANPQGKPSNKPVPVRDQNGSQGSEGERVEQFGWQSCGTIQHTQQE